MDLGLRDKVAVITGASVGIGLAVAEGLAAEGAHIVLAARQGDRLSKEARRIAKQYGVKNSGCRRRCRHPCRCAGTDRRNEQEVQGCRHPDQQRRHRLQ